VVNPAQSSSFFRESNRFYVNTGLEYRKKDFTFTPSLRVLIQGVNNDLASSPTGAVKQRSNDLLPGLSMTYKQFNFNYSEDVSLPFYTYLMPVADNTNPYYISKGNPDLLPSERHNFSVNYYFNNTKKNMNIGLNANGGFVQNDIIQSITIDSKGVQTNVPVNTKTIPNLYTAGTLGPGMGLTAVNCCLIMKAVGRKLITCSNGVELP
jgi:hypothetical protein